MSAAVDQGTMATKVSNANALDVRGVSVRFGGLAALTDVNITAANNEVTGLIGPNGAGKTTLFNVITGFQEVKQGRVFLNDTEITRKNVTQRSRLGIARTFQRLEIFSSLSVLDNVRTASEIAAGRRSDRRPSNVIAMELLERVGVADFANRRADELSTGHARLVELARALATEPKLVLMDEPGSGLDDEESQAFGDLVIELAKEGVAILLVEHDVDLVMRVSNFIHVLDFGQIIASGTPAEIRSNEAVQAAYLGVDNA